MFMLVVIVMASLTPVLAENSAEYENGVYDDYEHENDYEYEYQWGWLTIRNHSAATNAPMIDSHFVVFRQHDEQLISIFATDEQSVTETLYLLQGEYFLEQQHVQHGYALLPRKYFVIEYGVHLEKSVANHPIIPTTPWLTITNEPVTVVAEGQTQSGYRETGSTITIVSGYAEGWKFTGWSIDGLMRHSEYLSLFFTMPDMDVMITAHWEFYETQEPEPEPTPEPTPTPTPSLPEPPELMGRVLVTKRAQGTNELLSGAVFEIRRHMDDTLVATIVTDHFGEATLDLPIGDYFIREIIPPMGFVINTDRRNFTISEGQMLSLVIQNYAVITPVVEENGRLLVTVLSSNTGQRIPNAVVTLHDVMTDAQIAEMTADQFGEASIFVESGNYFIRQRELPDGYILNFDRFPVTIRPNEMADIMIVARARPAPTSLPTPPAPSLTPAIPPVQAVPPTDVIADTETLGRLEIITRAEGSGNPLSGGLFAIYTSTDNRRIAQLTTGTGGLTYIELEAGQYFIRELRPTYGFLLEDLRILVDVAEGRVTQIEMTKERNFEIPYLDPDTYGGGIIYIPQTGQDMSLLHYGGGAFLLLISLVSAGFLVLKKGTPKQQSNG